MNFIGTHVRSKQEALKAVDAVIQCLQRIHENGLDTHLSLKLTQIGLDIDATFCRQQLERVLAAANAFENFVRIDMEETPYTEETLRIFEEAHAKYPKAVGIVLQTYLRRNAADLERMIAIGARIRLVKGGYWESSELVYRKKPDIDAAFLRDLESLLRRGTQPALATHDSAAINKAIEVAEEAGLGKDDFEFQMLFGVRPDLAELLVRRGYRVRSYVPYGTHWYEYVLGCIRRDPGRILRSFRSRATAPTSSRDRVSEHIPS
jgi:proline dehydrogenase